MCTIQEKKPNAGADPGFFPSWHNVPEKCLGSVGGSYGGGGFGENIEYEVL